MRGHEGRTTYAIDNRDAHLNSIGSLSIAALLHLPLEGEVIEREPILLRCMTTRIKVNMAISLPTPLLEVYVDFYSSGHVFYAS